MRSSEKKCPLGKITKVQIVLKEHFQGGHKLPTTRKDMMVVSRGTSDVECITEMTGQVNI